MGKFKKLSALLLLALVIPGYAKASTIGEEKGTTSITTITETSESSSFSLLEAAQKKRYSLFVGYSGNFKNSSREQEKDNKYNHVLEIGGAYTFQSPNNFGYSVYAGSDILFNSDNFLVGPKVGGSVNYSVVMLGSEMIMYTDARFARVFYRPYIGIGVGPLKVYGGYNIGIGNKGTFKEVNSFIVGVTVPLFWGK